MKGIGWRLVRLASWRTLLVMALTMGVLGMQSGRGTLAYFTDSVASTGNTLTAGNLKLKLNGSTGTGSITCNYPPARID
jgi:predicted ribosomally synthesized peptide with SipW-like signal peptide